MVRPSTRDEANAVVLKWHSHHKPVRAHRFALAAEVFDESDCPELVGIVIVASPVARALNDGRTFEVVRLCTNGYKNAASFLLGAAWRTCKAMGVRRLVSYTREDEHGTCYRAAGWRVTKQVRGEKWNHGNKSQRWLPGVYEPATEVVNRVRWEQSLLGNVEVSG